MSCSYCREDAQFECACEKPYMCFIHLKDHLVGKSGHQINEVSSKLKEFKSNILEKLKVISEVRAEIFSSSQFLIKEIERLCMKAFEKIYLVKKSLMEMLQNKNVRPSTIQEFGEINPSEMFLKPIINIENIRHSLANLYSQNFSSCIELSEIRKNRFFNCHGKPISNAVISKDRQMMATYGEDYKIRIWDLIQKKPLFILSNYFPDICYLKISKDSQLLISGSYNKLIIIWDILKRKQVAVLRGHQSVIKEVDVVKKSNFVLSRDDDTIYIWNFMKQYIIKKISFESKIYSLVLKENSHQLIFGSKNNIIYYDLGAFKILKEVEVCGKNLITTSDGGIIVTTSYDKNNIIITDELTFAILQKIIVNKKISKLVITPDNQFIISESQNNIIMWSITTGDKFNEFKIENDFFLLFKDNILISFSNDQIHIKEIDQTIKDIKINWPFKKYNHNSVTFSKSNKLISYTSEENAYVWDSDSKKVKNIFKPRKWNHIKFIRISIDGRIAITSDESIEIICWDLNTGEKIGELPGHTFKMVCGEFFNGSLNFASGSEDKLIQIWDLVTFTEKTKFKGHNNVILSIKFIENKNLLVSVSVTQIFIWNLNDYSKYAEIRLGIISDLKFKILVTDDSEFIFLLDYSRVVCIVRVADATIISGFEVEENIQNFRLNEEYDQDIFYLLNEFNIPISLANQ